MLLEHLGDPSRAILALALNLPTSAVSLNDTATLDIGMVTAAAIDTSMPPELSLAGKVVSAVLVGCLVLISVTGNVAVICLLNGCPPTVRQPAVSLTTGAGVSMGPGAMTAGSRVSLDAPASVGPSRQTNSLLTTPASISAASSCLLPTATALPTDRVGGRSVFVSRYSVTGLFLLNLSLADLLHVLVCAPCTLLSDYLLQMWPFGEFTCRLVNWAQSLVVLLCAFTHVVISFDRLAAVYWPIQRRRLLSMRSARGIVLSIWVLAAALSTPTLIVCRLVYSQDGVPTCQEVWTDVALPSVTASTSTSASTPMSTPTLEPVSSVSGASPSSRSLTRDAVLADLTSIRLANSTTSRPAHSDSTSRFNVDSGRAEWMTYLAYPTSTAANVVTSSSVVVEGAGLDQIYSLVLLLLQYIFPLVVITGTYTAIVLRIWGSSTPGELDVKRDEALNRSKKRVGNHNL